MWTQPNPAFNDGAHFRFKPLQTSHLTSNPICQHPISVLSCSHAAELIFQYGLDMGHVRYSAANHRHAVWHRSRPAALEVNEQIQYCEVLVPAILLCCGLTLRTIRRLIPHLHCRHTHALQNTPNLRHKSAVKASGMWRRGGLIFLVTEVDYRGWKAGVRCGVKRHEEFTQPHWSVHGGMSCQEK